MGPGWVSLHEHQEYPQLACPQKTHIFTYTADILDCEVGVGGAGQIFQVGNLSFQLEILTWTGTHYKTLPHPTTTWAVKAWVGVEISWKDSQACIACGWYLVLLATTSVQQWRSRGAWPPLLISVFHHFGPQCDHWHFWKSTNAQLSLVLLPWLSYALPCVLQWFSVFSYVKVRGLFTVH